MRMSSQWNVVAIVMVFAVAAGAQAQCPLEEILPAPAPANGNDFGIAVAVSGDHMIIGDPREDAPGWGAQGIDAGAAFFAERSGAWGPAVRQFPQPSTPQASGEAFGSAVAIDGDVAVIGAPGFDTTTEVNCGAAYVYRYNPGSGTWQYEARLLAFDGAFMLDTTSYETFGRSVAISGDVIVVGGPQKGPVGRACVYRYNGSIWLADQRLLPTSSTGSDRFGDAVAVDGDRIVVGAPQRDAGATVDAGAADVFEYASGSWNPLTAQLVPASPVSYTRHGAAVAIRGDTVLVGAPGADVGGVTSGAVWRYDWNGVSFNVASFQPPTPAAGMQFGAAVALDGDIAAGGAWNASSSGGGGAGLAFVWERVGGVWGSATVYEEPTPSANHWFGRSVAVGGTDVAVGAPGMLGSGNAYVVDVACAPPPPQTTLVFDPPAYYGASADVFDLVTADFDRDGNLDVASVGGATEMRVKWGDGTGGFDPGAFAFSFAGFLDSIVAADFNGDGLVDLALGNSANQEIVLIENVGGRSFAYRNTVSLPRSPSDLATGEFTGDCRPDLVTADEVANRMTVWENTGNWSFSVFYVRTTGNGPTALDVGDIDGDGDDDIALATSIGRSVAFYENIGQNYMVGFAASSTLGSSGQFSDVKLLDLEGDGDLDAVAVNPVTGELYTLTYNGVVSLAASGPIALGGSTWRAATIDIDGDNDTDVVVSDQDTSPSLIVLQNYGLGTFAPPVTLANIGYGPYVVVASDLDFDGRRDLITGSVQSGLYVLMNRTAHDCNGNNIPDTQEPIATGSIGVVGPSNGGTCSWEVGTPLLTAGHSSNGCAPVGSPAEELASRFIAQINGLKIPALRARHVPGLPRYFEIAAPGASIDMCFGTAGQPPSCCLFTTGACVCNPALVLLSGEDCNANGEDDAIDIYLGVSVDANGDGVPDECETPTYGLGDMNCDGAVSAADIDGFVLALTGGADAYAAAYPDCAFSNADCNGDDVVSAADIDAFVGLLTGGGSTE
jgi:hypothetical protein